MKLCKIRIYLLINTHLHKEGRQLMANVTIVSDELSKERVEQLQEKVTKLEEENNYSAHAIQHYLGYYENLRVSLACEKRNIIMNCRQCGR